MLRRCKSPGGAEQLPSGNMPAAQAAAFEGPISAGGPSLPGIAATVNVREADDVVSPVYGPDCTSISASGMTPGFLRRWTAPRNICPLAFAEQAHLVAVGDFRRAADHNPVLCPVVVLLQGELFARLDDDALYLEAIPAG